MPYTERATRKLTLESKLLHRFLPPVDVKITVDFGGSVTETILILNIQVGLKNWLLRLILPRLCLVQGHTHQPTRTRPPPPPTLNTPPPKCMTLAGAMMVLDHKGRIVYSRTQLGEGGPHADCGPQHCGLRTGLEQKYKINRHQPAKTNQATPTNNAPPPKARCWATRPSSWQRWISRPSSRPLTARCTPDL
jgi:hypothetical protein